MVLAGLLASCTGNQQVVCEPIGTEDLDPLSSQHVVPGAEVTYLSDPPTSGPHLGIPAPGGIVDGTLDPAIQVTALEAGSVIIHHDGEVDLDDVLDLAADDVLIVESADLGQPVELTAWRTRQRCSAADRASVQAFIRAHAGRAPNH